MADGGRDGRVLGVERHDQCGGLEGEAAEEFANRGDGDRLVAAKAIRLTRRICGARALARFAPEEFLPGPGFQSDEQLAKAAGDIGTTIFHPAGTCRMGQGPMAVVDDRLRVHGLEGLRVVDAGIMPTITSGNTNSPVVMIAEKASDMIKEDARG